MGYPPTKILVALDLSEPSFWAWSHAAALARRFGSTLEALYVQDLEALIEPKDPALLSRLAAEVVRQLARRVGRKVPIRVQKGPPAETIVREAARDAFDLIVMGSHGRTGLRRFVLGSVAASVVRSSSVPVLVVRAPYRPLRSVLAPVHQADYAEPGAEMAAQVARVHRAALEFLEVVARPEQVVPARLRMRRRLEALTPRFARSSKPRGLVRIGRPLEKIARAAAASGLTVLTSHRRDFLDEALLGTTVERVIRRVGSAVLAVPAGLREAA